MTTTLRSVLAALLLMGSVSAELIWHELDEHLLGHLGFAAMQTCGWALLLTVALSLRRSHPGPRLGSGAVTVGCGLQVLFGLGYGASTAVTGEPFGGIFVVFLLAFLALTVGGIAWGLSLRRAGFALAGTGLLVTAGTGFLAIALEMDPWHDVFLLTSFAAWVLVGRGIEVPATVPTRVSASSR
jgi:hypothetical protein